MVLVRAADVVVMPSRRATVATARGPPACNSSRTVAVLIGMGQRVLDRDAAAEARRR
jgi:hypothetical protein